VTDDTLSTWLQLREAADTAARSERLTRLIADALRERGPLRVLDLATGTGANVRYLAPRLPRVEHWLTVDRDPTLLALLPALTSSECHVETRQLDLGVLPDDIVAGRHLVTGSALLDLVSERWLIDLAARCRAVGAAVLFATTYNGRSSCSPAEPDDEMVRDLLNRHQTRDKGLGGPAVGPDATECARRSFEALGYRVRTEPSDWTLGPAERELQRRLIGGWAEAAIEMHADATTVARWRDRRIQHLDAGRSRIVVGHSDLAAVPAV
jgi:hypothetical protein